MDDIPLIALIPGLLLMLWGTIIAARTIRAFVQGINEGDDPRTAKRPPGPP